MSKSGSSLLWGLLILVALIVTFIKFLYQSGFWIVLIIVAVAVLIVYLVTKSKKYADENQPPKYPEINNQQLNEVWTDEEWNDCGDIRPFGMMIALEDCKQEDLANIKENGKVLLALGESRTSYRKFIGGYDISVYFNNKIVGFIKYSKVVDFNEIFGGRAKIIPFKSNEGIWYANIDVQFPFPVGTIKVKMPNVLSSFMKNNEFSDYNKLIGLEVDLMGKYIEWNGERVCTFKKAEMDAAGLIENQKRKGFITQIDGILYVCILPEEYEIIDNLFIE